MALLYSRKSEPIEMQRIVTTLGLRSQPERLRLQVHKIEQPGHYMHLQSFCSSHLHIRDAASNNHPPETSLFERKDEKKNKIK